MDTTVDARFHHCLELEILYVFELYLEELVWLGILCNTVQYITVHSVRHYTVVYIQRGSIVRGTVGQPKGWGRGKPYLSINPK